MILSESLALIAATKAATSLTTGSASWTHFKKSSTDASNTISSSVTGAIVLAKTAVNKSTRIAKLVMCLYIFYFLIYITSKTIKNNFFVQKMFIYIS